MKTILALAFSVLFTVAGVSIGIAAPSVPSPGGDLGVGTVVWRVNESGQVIDTYRVIELYGSAYVGQGGPLDIIFDFDSPSPQAYPVVATSGYIYLTKNTNLTFAHLDQNGNPTGWYVWMTRGNGSDVEGGMYYSGDGPISNAPPAPLVPTPVSGALDDRDVQDP